MGRLFIGLVVLDTVYKLQESIGMGLNVLVNERVYADEVIEGGAYNARRARRINDREMAKLVG